MFWNKYIHWPSSATLDQSMLIPVSNINNKRHFHFIKPLYCEPRIPRRSPKMWRSKIFGVVALLIFTITRVNSRTLACRQQYPLSATDSSLLFKNLLLDVRGGASKTRNTNKARRSASLSSKGKTVTGKKKVGTAVAKEQPSAFAETMQKYKRILPLTRFYITMVGLATMLGLVLGEELTQGLLALDPIRTIYGMEFWRPITAACFLGPPSIGWLMSGYYLFEYGSSLERAYGTPQHFMFLLSQLVVLSIFSVLTGQPFFASSMITAMLHVLSRSMPHQKVKWLVFTVPYWSLPYGLMATDVLQAQSAMAALPHVLGILSGHFYHFHKFVWPKMKGEDWLAAPEFVVNRLGQ
jgi:Derlin-1